MQYLSWRLYLGSAAIVDDKDFSSTQGPYCTLMCPAHSVLSPSVGVAHASDHVLLWNRLGQLSFPQIVLWHLCVASRTEQPRIPKACGSVLLTAFISRSFFFRGFAQPCCDSEVSCECFLTLISRPWPFLLPLSEAISLLAHPSWIF